MTKAEPIKDRDCQPQDVYWKIWGKGTLFLLKLLNCKDVSWTFQGPIMGKILLKNEAHAQDSRSQRQRDRGTERKKERERERGRERDGDIQRQTEREY